MKLAVPGQAPLQASRLIPRHIFSELAQPSADSKDSQDAPQKKGQCAKLIDLRLPGNLSNCIRV